MARCRSPRSASQPNAPLRSSIGVFDGGTNSPIQLFATAMRFVVPAVLLLVALIHALPVLGVVSAARVSSLYGIAVQDSNLEILMRHRAVLFGLLAAFLAYAAFHRHLHSLALIAAAVSVVAFLALAISVRNYNSALSTVVKADILALALLVIAAIVHLLTRGDAAYST